jgi:hypothetical protein
LDLIFSGNRARVSRFDNRAACVPFMFSRSAYFLIERGKRFGLIFFTQNRRKKNVKKEKIFQIDKTAQIVRFYRFKTGLHAFFPVRLRGGFAH